MSRQIDLSKRLTADEKKYLADRDMLPVDHEDVRGTPEEPGLDYIPVDPSEQADGSTEKDDEGDKPKSKK